MEFGKLQTIRKVPIGATAIRAEMPERPVDGVKAVAILTCHHPDGALVWKVVISTAFIPTLVKCDDEFPRKSGEFDYTSCGWQPLNA